MSYHKQLLITPQEVEVEVHGKTQQYTNRSSSTNTCTTAISSTSLSTILIQVL